MLCDAFTFKDGVYGILRQFNGCWKSQPSVGIDLGTPMFLPEHTDQSDAASPKVYKDAGSCMCKCVYVNTELSESLGGVDGTRLVRICR